MNPCKLHKNFSGDVCPVCLRNENDFLKIELRQTQARLNHADKEIDRLANENKKYKEEIYNASHDQRRQEDCG